MRIMLDQNAPRGLRGELSGHTVRTAREMGWDQLENGLLIAAAETGGFDALITTDQNIQYQQKLTARQIALVVLDTNHWNVIQRDIQRVRDTIDAVTQGAYVTLAFDRPTLIRRSYPAPQA